MTEKKQKWVYRLGTQAENWSEGTRVVAQGGMDYINELAKHSQSSRFHEALVQVDATIKLLAHSIGLNDAVIESQEAIIANQGALIANYEQIFEALKQRFPEVRDYLSLHSA